MRGRGLCLVMGMKMGQNQAKQAAALKQQGAEEAKAQAATAQAAPAAAATATPVPAAQAAPAPAAAGPGTDVIAQLQKLADLHNAGLLSEEEFAAAKKKCLGV